MYQKPDSVSGEESSFIQSCFIFPTLFFIVSIGQNLHCPTLSFSLRSVSSWLNKKQSFTVILILLKPEVDIINILCAAFTCGIPNAPKRQSSCQSFLRFQDLFVQKMLVECWRNLTQMSILSMFFEQLLHK